MVHDLRVALELDDPAGLEALLSADVAVVVDAGDEDRLTIRVVRGRREAVGLLRHGVRAPAGARLREREVNGQPGLVLQVDERLTAAMAVDVADRRIRLIWVRLHPVPLTHGLAV